jgi:uncharacterized membrane protein YhaH (DUF805 family)
MDNDLRTQIYRNFDQKDTDELIEIWQTNNQIEWTEMTFDVIREILQKRLPKLPPQDIPITKASELNKKDSIEDTSMSFAQLYFSLNGRIGITTFWLKGALPLVAFAFILGIIDGAYFDYSPYSGMLSILSRLFIIWPSIALTVKRWHDRDRSGWWILIGLIPVFGTIWAFIVNGFIPGTKGANRYGSKSF